MATTLEEVRSAILSEEPDYARAAARLGPEALPFLEELAGDEDTMIAMKAVSLAGVIGGTHAARIAEGAADSRRPEMRIVAAGAASRLGDAGEPILTALLDDHDRGVRKNAIRAIGPRSSPALRHRLEALRDTETDLALRDLVTNKLSGLH